ncbi:hypothetical protein GNI_071950 [Gregarina niphandrodes]|uniref:Uncharacterized protein n=1 Tax=Gregarina niphandrodes TaxID=110365 RepID=A0A023B7D0_GRENI|nr:hypothetical protein GNI_071950 [Gregarina niphandrodes]EZG67083.1 hypothetical protein GNI_071950 [Gregarina niphandrodes]|eukprot:XP_011130337.1 hypothetical protein GNI_071950 [Gregarina niphandrodes]
MTTFSNVFYVLEDNGRRIHTRSFIETLATFDVSNILPIGSISEMKDACDRIPSRRNFLVAAADIAQSIPEKEYKSVSNFGGALLYCGPHEEYFARWAMGCPEVVLFLTHNFKELRRAVVWLAADGSFGPSGDPIAPPETKLPRQQQQQLRRQAFVPENLDPSITLERPTVPERAFTSEELVDDARSYARLVPACPSGLGGGIHPMLSLQRLPPRNDNPMSARYGAMDYRPSAPELQRDLRPAEPYWNGRVLSSSSALSALPKLPDSFAATEPFTDKGAPEPFADKGGLAADAVQQSVAEQLCSAPLSEAPARHCSDSSPGSSALLRDPREISSMPADSLVCSDDSADDSTRQLAKALASTLDSPASSNCDSDAAAATHVRKRAPRLSTSTTASHGDELLGLDRDQSLEELLALVQALSVELPIKNANPL